MEKQTCKLCFRRFLNGRALGGHMRSHVISASAHVGPGGTSASSPEEPEPTPLSYILRENPKKSIRISDPDQYVSIEQGDDESSASIVQDQESDNDSPPAAPRRRRSKRRRRSSPPPLLDFEPASSISTASLELEDVARSLMLLSRDVWIRSDPKSKLKAETEPELLKKAKNRFQCESCKKMFKSFQALGGHRASFRRGKGGCVGENPNANPTQEGSDPLMKGNGNANIPSSSPSSSRAVHVHQCPYCPRVFSSGQALGGHKRSHLYSSSNGNPCGNSSANHVINGGNVEMIQMNSLACASSSPIGLIDLNMPASAEDEFELSAVYDGGV
ncbi:hypothetical protein LUZ60_014419 [Juncus effusus]|nr:hypothetical protein LUZ60_014419 [Juncus effusus]